MFPILFESSGFILYTQTVCILLAFMSGLLITIHEGNRFAIPQYELTNIILIGFLSSILGARVAFLLLFWDPSAFTLKEFCTLGTYDGGFAFHGGLVAGGLTSVLLARYYHRPLWRLADSLAPGLAIAMFFMRLGCLFNGCDYGIATSAPWGIWLHGAHRHPIQLYEGLSNLLLLPVLIVANKKPLRPGSAFLWYMILSSLIRFGVDVYREEYRAIWNVFTIPQMLAAGIAVAAGIILIVKKHISSA